MPKRSRLLCLLCSGLALTSLWWGVACEQSAESAAGQSEPRPIDVGVVEAWTSPVERTIRLVGTTRAVDAVAVTAQVTGTVAWIGFDDEQLIEVNTPMVRLDPRRAEADVRAAEARTELLRQRLARLEEVRERGGTNPIELDDARRALDEAEATLDRDKVVLSDHQILAPFTGRVTRRLVSLGALVSPGTSVAVLNTVDPIEIRFAVPEAFLAELRPGLPVQAFSPAYGDRPFRGELAGIGAEINPDSRAAEVFARVPNDHGLLRPGMFMSVRLVLDARDQAVILPESALVVEGTRTEVFIVKDDATVDRRRVRIASRFPGLAEIAEGVRPGEVVVTSGVQKLRQGTRVAPEPDQDLLAMGILPGRPLSEQPGMREPANMPADETQNQTSTQSGAR